MKKLILVIGCLLVAACNRSSDYKVQENAQQSVQKKSDTSPAPKKKSSSEAYMEKRAREKALKSFGIKDYDLEYDWQYQQQKKLMKSYGLGW